jgi:uncharacterized protein (DUF2235 family)
MKPKRIILLSDGTGNSAAKVWRTNVWRVFESVDLSDPQQVAYYDDGVGTSSFKPLAVLGGAVGWGLKRNVLDLYRFLCRNYQNGDQIYGFGFSRGAFTMRVLTGLVISQGLVRAQSESELQRLAAAAYRQYRKERYHTLLHVEAPFRAIRDGITAVMDRIRKRTPYDKARNAEVGSIRFLGLWDTVAAYGLPIEEMTRGVSVWLWPLSLPDRRLSDKIDRACHAIALDDERTTFHPVLWNEQGLRVYPHRDAAGQPIVALGQEKLSQVWFAGVHSNVGGGYPDDSLAHLPLVWIMNEAKACGLKFKAAPDADPDAYKHAISAADKDGRLYDSRHGLSGYYRYGPRKIFDLCHMRFSRKKDDVVAIDKPKIHETAFRRTISGAHAYAPFGFPRDYAVAMADGRILEGKDNPFETADQARARADVQERVWNLVWWRRVVYFATLAASFHVALFPLLHGTNRAAEFSSPASWVSQLVRLVGDFLPGFAKWWIDSFAANPRWFVIGVATIVGLMSLGVNLGGRINDQMRRTWSAILKQDAQPEGSLPDDWVYRLRTHPAYQGVLRAMKRYVVPTLSAALLLYLGVALINQIAFNVADAAGAFCPKDSRSAERLARGESRTVEGFDTGNFCWPTGIALERGSRYRITLSETAPWQDGGISTDLNGFEIGELRYGATRLAMFFALPLRRVLTTPWLRPIARIGTQGSDEYALDPETPGTLQPAKSDQLAATLYARRDGELFLFVNDAVIGVPGIGQPFYRNNRGQASVTVERLGRRDTPARPIRANQIPPAVTSQGGSG